ncbi:hypothetical protein CBI36_02905 [Acetobacter oryzifermentans]|uniref:Uncharacterized protein n=2 Tax=Acetobacter TaxID=434 RepID=A0AAN1PJ75_9PROT|nr:MULTISPECIES: hypothetical protein [Acetobacter]ASL39503.1 hypothetical protein CBI36_02905 [Acetobacter oryzifermentans]AXN01069.1 hypothetical protein CJF59_11295 [Acetobacter pomorum]
MTETHTNLPEPTRPSIPMFPDRDGRHLIGLGGGVIIAFWRADKKWLVCDDNHDLGFCASEKVQFLDYIGPVLTPAQINEMLATESKRSFNFGYLTACCNLCNMHNEGSIAADVLSQVDITQSEVAAMDLSEYDSNALQIIRRSRIPDPILKDREA